MVFSKFEGKVLYIKKISAFHSFDHMVHCSGVPKSPKQFIDLFSPHPRPPHPLVQAKTLKTPLGQL